MPESYFRLVNPEVRSQHLRAITALSSPDLTVPEVKLTDETAVTFISSGSTPAPAASTDAVTRQLASLPEEAALRRVLLFSSRDASLSLNVFEMHGAGAVPLFGADPSARLEEMAFRVRLKEYAAQLASGAFVGQAKHPAPSAMLSESELERFLQKCSSRFVVQHMPRLFYKQMRLYQMIAGTDAVALEIEHGYEDEKGSTLISAAFPGLPPRAALEKASSLLGQYGLGLRRALVDEVVDPEGDVTMLRVVVTPEGSGLGEAAWTQLATDLKRLKWLDDSVLALASAYPSMGIQRAEVAMALSSLSLAVLDHPLLGRPQVFERLTRPHVAFHVQVLADLFLQRHAPSAPLPDDPFNAALEAWEKSIETALGDEENRSLLRTMGSAVRFTLRSNAFLPERSALLLRMNPVFFQPALPPSPNASNLPFGVFFGAGKHFNGYHVRFRDVARGGLRVVLPASKEAHTAESRRHFNECFSLAWAQQLKNKDIPEGGSKAVILVEPVPGAEREALLHGCVKRFTDGLLDLLTPDPAVRSLIAFSDTQRPELLYLGPDENITTTDIDWVVDRAAKRGYPMAAAFMSSKPKAGINHKVYGVTSEGVAVFLDSGLRSLGIQPTAQPWTVKLTGGPDGDVAGNMLKILHREYGSMVRVVGIADGSGCAEDPEGLPMQELLRLVEANLPLVEFNEATLGPQGALFSAATAEGAAKRNSLHARVPSDALVPAGGRPSTVNASNWKEMLLPDGTPSSRIVVEGANLFLTADARQALFDSVRLPIVKDSSANKCGVICSSMEIVASMTLSTDEFLGFKDRYVAQVLDRLRALARLEADLLFTESARQPDMALPLLSERISHAMIRVSDSLGKQLDAFGDAHKSRLWPLLHQQLPPVLFEAHAARLPELLPWEYTKEMISSGLAGRLVYREGLQYVEGMGDERLSAVSLAYLQQEQRVRKLAAEVAASGLASASAIESLLMQGGVRAAIHHLPSRK